jgi:hypothetical protein
MIGERSRTHWNRTVNVLIVWATSEQKRKIHKLSLSEYMYTSSSDEARARGGGLGWECNCAYV